MKAEIFERAGNDMLLEGTHVSCYALMRVSGEKFLEYKMFWTHLHSDGEILTIREIDDAARDIGMDDKIFRVQLFHELAYSLRYQGFSK